MYVCTLVLQGVYPIKYKEYFLCLLSVKYKKPHKITTFFPNMQIKRIFSVKIYQKWKKKAPLFTFRLSLFTSPEWFSLGSIEC